MEAKSLGSTTACSIVNNPNELLEQIYLEAQGIYDKNGEVKYWEYLTRFNDITGKVVGDCFDILEKKENSFNWFTTVVSKIVDKIIKKSQLNPLGFNALPNDILDEKFLYQCQEILKRAPNNQSVILEVIEKHLGLQKDIEIISHKLIDIQNSGFLIAIDDIYINHPSILDEPSQGKNNLDNLMKEGLIPDIIKVDGAKMNLLFDNRNNIEYQELIQEYKIELNNICSIVTGHGKECVIVAEWVNTLEEIEFATSLGCNAFQGFKLEKLFSESN